MPSPIEHFSADVFECFVANLRMNDLVSLMQVSKAYKTFLEPLLWTRIEVHNRDFHVDNVHAALRVEEAAERPNLPYDLGLSYAAKERSEELLKTFSTHETWGKGLSGARRSYLGSMIKWLCLAVEGKNIIYDNPSFSDPWNSFADFANLEYLSISGFWIKPSTSPPFSAPEHGLAKLRTLKLSGYFPKEFVQWLLKEPGCIEELQLGIIDAPVGSSNVEPSEWENPPPPENCPPENMDGLSAEEIEKWENVESLVSEYVAPRPLACLTQAIMDQLTNLKKLYLIKPGNGDVLDEDVLYFSEPSDRRIFEEWKALLRATRKTLEHITLDQRPVASENVADGTPNKPYMRRCANGPSYKRFVEIVLPVLLENTECPNLKVIRFFGFERDTDEVDECYGGPDHPDGSVDLPKQLQTAFPDADISTYLGRRLLIWNDSGVTLSDGDVLVTSNSFDSDSEDED